MDARRRERVPGEALRGGNEAQADHEAPSSTVAVGSTDRPLVGVLALQGDVLENLRMLRASGARAVPVKRVEELQTLDGILIPGGESTAIGKLAQLYGLLEPLRAGIEDGLPAFGTCAGAILLAREALGHDGRPSPQPLLGAMDVVMRRNAFGRQVASFEADIDVTGVTGGPMRAAFIRAPWIEKAGAGVTVLARVDTVAGAKVVVARQGPVLASAFHPELTGDARLHQLFVALVRAHHRQDQVARREPREVARREPRQEC